MLFLISRFGADAHSLHATSKFLFVSVQSIQLLETISSVRLARPFHHLGRTRAASAFGPS